MYGGGPLAMTGTSVMLLGHMFGLNWVVAAAVGAVLGGIVLTRLGTRRMRRTNN
jgi:hypothetical protein